MALRNNTNDNQLVDIQRRHFNMTAQRCGLGADMEAIIADVVAKTP